MLGWNRRESVGSWVVLSLALILTALLPNIVVGDSSGGPQAQDAPPPAPSFSASSFTDTTVADFSAGSPDANIYLSETTDGEVILQPAFGTEFSGTSLPAGMSMTPWTAGGTANVAGGHIVIDAARVGTDATFGPGRSLEFVEIESGGIFEMGGFGQTFQLNQPFAAFRTGIVAFKLQAATNDGSSVLSDDIGPYSGPNHTLRVDWTATGVSYYVDDALAATHAISPSVDLRPLFSDSPFGGRVLTLDWARLSPYAPSGVFESRVFDALSRAHFTTLDTTVGRADIGTVAIETRTGDSPAPDASWSPWAPLSGNAIVSPDARYLQYRATLTTSDSRFTPALQSVVIDFLAPCTEEVCNGVDDDCDGLVDEGLQSAATTCGVGACASSGRLECVAGQSHDTCQAGQASSELDATCDGIDDDCDGKVDEDFAGEETHCGAGACAATGRTVCVDGKIQDTCQAGTGGGIDATCNGIDDDCDGTIDEDFTGEDTHCGVGACAATGRTTCVEGQVRDTCQPAAGSETDTTCNGIDDDCDGKVDEDFSGAETHCGVGACAASGRTTCVEGQVRDTCQPATGSETDTTCNGIDDDCDGKVDDDFTGTETHCGVGACAATGRTTCVEGQIHDTCQAGQPATRLDTVCNGIDDDCDGLADEDFTGEVTQCGVGACASTGRTVCVDGQVHDTCQLSQPSTRVDSICNGIDDDCDGLTDEDFVSQDTHCGTGACAAIGHTACVAGATRDTCVPGAASTEICDGLDNDCDGMVDEGFALGTACVVGVGGCQRTGVLVCAANGQGTVCNAQPGLPSNEVCDGIDNNCDGTIDEGAQRFQATCSLQPDALNLGSQGSTFTFTLSLQNTCNVSSPLPIAPSAIGLAHLSRAGNKVYPDPATIACPAATGGTAFETGLFEDLPLRSISGNTVTFKFDKKSDGVCTTRDGSRQELLDAVSDQPDNSMVTVCATGLANGQVYECCAASKFIRRGTRK